MTTNENLSSREKRMALERIVTSVPFIETIVLSVIGIVISVFAPTEWVAALLAVGFGLAMSLGRLAFDVMLKQQLVPVHQLAEIVDLQNKINNAKFIELFHLHLSISNSEFSSIKDSIIEEAASHLSELAKRGRSRELPTGAYYKWLFSMLEAQRDGEIWAVSTGNPLEWTDSPAERKFTTLNQEAALRGIRLQRVFIVNDALRESLIKSSNVSWHFDRRQNVHGFVASHEELSKKDRNLLSAVGDGFIAFDKRVIMIDVFSDSGNARGYVTIDSAAINNLFSKFEQLRDTFGEEIILNK